ncbi:MAG: PKD domain-containing protein [Cecembia sp.]
MRIRVVLISVLVFAVFGILLIPEAQAQSTTIGREFFVGFMENHRVTPNRIDIATLLISAEEDAEGFIEYPNNRITFSIKSGEQFVYEFPTTGVDVIHRSSRIVEDKGVYVFSNGNIAVHAFNFRERSADGTVVLPLSSIGKDYWVTSHYEQFAEGTNPGSNRNFESTLLIVATENDTKIEILLSAQSLDPIPVPAGSTLNIELNRGESYQIKAVGDLTGTRVRVVGSSENDCKNIAVFGGNKMTSVGRDCEDASTGDHLFQQIYPTFSWGREYIHIPLAGRTSGEMVKVLAAENNTKVFVNGQERANINAGKFTTFSFGRDELASITADRPIAVTVFAKSYKCNIQVGPSASNGDPTMITLSPNPQMVRTTVFSSVRVVGIVDHFVNILVPINAVNQTVLDGVNVGNQFNPVPGNPNYAYAQIKVDEGSHTFSNPEGLIAYAYGSGFIESYGYSAGASLNNLNYETEVAYDFDVFGENVACLGENGSWTVMPRNPKFEIFEWNFGDGSEMKEGQTVDHKFEKPGVYQVKIVALTGTMSCDEIEEAFFEVEVLETFGEIEGPESVCPEIDEATYVFENPINVQKVIWDVEGGEILEADDFSVRIRWGEFNTEAKVFAIPVTDQGCLASLKAYEVFVNEFIEPGLAKGFSQICFEEGLTYRYEVKDRIPNRRYAWLIEGGTLLSDPTSPEVEVDWGPIGTVGEIWYEEFSEINSSCLGESKKLQVTVNPPLRAEVAELTEFICPGAAEGFIRLNVTGGSGQYRFIWSHDPELDAPLADGLLPGIYEVQVLDVGGCELFLEQLEIKESEPMELEGNPAIVDALCFDSKDGYVSFNIKGGVPPYRVDTESVLIMGGSIQVFDLARGDYVFKVFDAAKCLIEVEVSIGSPDALSINYEIEQVACPGIASGALKVLPEGGTAPYTITWEWDGSEGPSLMDIPAGTYAFNMTDANGCSQNFTAAMKEGFPQLRMPTGFIPSEGLFMGVSNCSIEFKLMVYNKWGQLLFAGNSGWDGHIEGEMAPAGTYSYMIEYYFNIDGVGKSRQQRGVFTLIR